MASALGWTLAAFLLTETLAFFPVPVPFVVKSTTHADITRRAILRKTAEVCRDLAQAQGRDFILMGAGEPEPIPASNGCKARHSLDKTVHHRADTQMHTHTRANFPRSLLTYQYVSDSGRKLEHLAKTHKIMEKTYKLPADS